MNSEILGRVRDKSLHGLITEPGNLIKHFAPVDGRTLNVGWSGFTPSGYPKVLPQVLADHIETHNLQGKWKYNLFVGASTGAECEGRWAQLKMIHKRWPYQTGTDINRSVNNGEVRMGDKHLSSFAQDLFYGFYTMDNAGRIDCSIIEASAITEDGNIVLTGAVGATPEIIAISDKIIVEVNTLLPSFEGMHDIVMSDMPPNKKIIPIIRACDRVGTTYVPTDKSKIVGIIESRGIDMGRSLRGSDAQSEMITGHILDFFKHEVKYGRLPANLLPIQSGVGSIANAVLGGLVKSDFENMSAYSEVLQDTFLPLLDSGKMVCVSCSSLSLSEEGYKRWWENYDFYKERVTLRPQQISNHPEVIRRLGVIAMNTPVEIDIYAHANSTMVNASRMLNGIGGSNDFLRNGFLSIMHTPSVRASKKDEFGISCIVPMVTHVDQTEHDLDVVVTERGLADVRGLAPKDRARVIIKNCAHPAYQDYLTDYLDRAKVFTHNAHEPQMLAEAYALHIALSQKGSMRFWNGNQ